jgi:CDP-diglyceride synthetase
MSQMSDCRSCQIKTRFLVLTTMVAAVLIVGKFEKMSDFQSCVILQSLSHFLVLLKTLALWLLYVYFATQTMYICTAYVCVAAACVCVCTRVRACVCACMNPIEYISVLDQTLLHNLHCIPQYSAVMLSCKCITVSNSYACTYVHILTQKCDH